MHAAYVDARPQAPAEVERARKVITRTAEFVYERLNGDGRMLACIDASMAVCRFLERQGVWSYMVKGALRADFLTPTRRSYWFAPISIEPTGAQGAHCWVCAPPFKIVDVAAKCQPYPKELRRVLYGPVLEEKPEAAEPDAANLFEPDALELFQRQERRSPPSGTSTKSPSDLGPASPSTARSWFGNARQF